MKRKLIAAAAALVLLLSLLPATALAAMSGRIEGGKLYWFDGSVQNNASITTYSSYNPHGFGVWLPNLRTGETDWEPSTSDKTFRAADGSSYVAYCLQAWKASTSAGVHELTSDTAWQSVLGGSNWRDIRDAIRLALAYGSSGRLASNGTKRLDDYNTSSTEKWGQIATQAVIWDLACGYRDPYTFRAQDPAYTDGTTRCQRLWDSHSNFNAAYQELLWLLQNHTKIPSFTVRRADLVTDSKGTIWLDYDRDAGVYKATVTDTTGVLTRGGYNFAKSSGGLTIKQSGNTLTVTATPAAAKALGSGGSVSGSGGWIYDTVGNGVLLAYDSGDTGLQQLCADTGRKDPANAYFRIKANLAGNVRIVKTSEDGKISGVTFRITGNGVDEVVKTGSNGEITVMDLVPGNYTVTETVGSQYEPVSSKEVTVSSSRTTTVNFANTLKRGSLTITKSSEDGLVEGMTFRLTGTSASGAAVDLTAVTGKDGKATFADVPIGSGYKLEEINTPSYYIVPASQTVDIEWNKTTQAKMHNSLKKGSLIVTKTAEDGLVEGMTFRLTGTSASGAAVDLTAVTGKDGKATFADVPIGSGYKLEEVKTPNQYIIPAVQDITIRWDEVTQANMNNALKKGSLTVTKTAEDGLVEGMTFRLTGTSDSGAAVDLTATTDEDGKATFNNVLIGSGYKLEEINTPGYYIVPDSQDVAIQWNKVTEAEMHNALKKGSLTVTKTSEDGLVEGMTFRLTGTADSGAAVDLTAVTGEDGKATFTDVPIGSGYVLEEMNTAERYVVPAQQTVAIRWNEVTQASMENALKKWQITVTKEDAETGSTAQGAASLEGAVYGVYRGDDLMDTYVTDAQGQFTTKYYPCGQDWTIRELQPSPGYQLDPTSYPVGAEPGLFILERNSLSMTVTEQVIRGDILGYKADAETGQALAGAVFGIFSLDTDVYDTTTALQCARADDEGRFSFTDLLYGSYVIRELEPAEGYRLDTALYPVTIQGTDPVEIHLTNRPTEITVFKADEQGKPLAGAQLTVYDAAGNQVAQGVTDETGKLTVKGLASGSYTVQETRAPSGFAITRTVLTVEILPDGSVVQEALLLVDAATEITVFKTDEQGRPLAGVEFTLLDAQGNVLDVQVTGEDGKATFVGFPDGTLTIRETGTPEGYVPAADVEICNDGTWDNAAQQEIVVVNEPVPNTGDAGIDAWAAMMALSAAAMTITTILRRKRHAQ